MPSPSSSTKASGSSSRSSPRSISISKPPTSSTASSSASKQRRPSLNMKSPTPLASRTSALRGLMRSAKQQPFLDDDDVTAVTVSTAQSSLLSAPLASRTSALRGLMRSAKQQPFLDDDDVTAVTVSTAQSSLLSVQQSSFNSSSSADLPSSSDHSSGAAAYQQAPAAVAVTTSRRRSSIKTGSSGGSNAGPNQRLSWQSAGTETSASTMVSASNPNATAATGNSTSSLDQFRSVRGARTTGRRRSSVKAQESAAAEEADDIDDDDDDGANNKITNSDSLDDNNSTHMSLRRSSLHGTSTHQRHTRRLSMDSSKHSAAKRNVTFKNQVRVRKCLHHLSYTDEEWESTWYTDFEMDRLKLKTQRMLDAIEDGDIPVQRGLECHTREGSEKRNIHKEATRQAVLDEQAYQQQEGIRVPELISKASCQTSVSSRTQALIMGMMDHQFIAQELEEVLARFAPPASKPQKRGGSCHSRRTFGKAASSSTRKQRSSSSNGRRRRRSSRSTRRQRTVDSATTTTNTTNAT
eukprot:CAMPEP_0119570306 /NCGR_PEP_ID=MMETSP1352-20130426/43549_1 /TAXON_ID=265584 /ORGANISM="Stauroneis constricta, Strain CCMP1120" /LENGTH=522 /DNA_ID=CAMNT_0007619973 /DNA_START=102 /DNA_END=1666 /DNA_ORIENTATION=-